MIIKFKIFENNSNIDRILDKISDKGITSLTDEDKYYLDGSDKNQVFEDDLFKFELNSRKNYVDELKLYGNLTYKLTNEISSGYILINLHNHQINYEFNNNLDNNLDKNIEELFSFFYYIYDILDENEDLEKNMKKI